MTDEEFSRKLDEISDTAGPACSCLVIILLLAFAFFMFLIR
jgi:hypothetical protein